MLAELLENIRIKKNWSYYRLAKELGITQTQLKHYLKNDGSTRESILIKAAEISELSIDEIWSKFADTRIK